MKDIEIAIDGNQVKVVNKTCGTKSGSVEVFDFVPRQDGKLRLWVIRTRMTQQAFHGLHQVLKKAGVVVDGDAFIRLEPTLRMDGIEQEESIRVHDLDRGPEGS